MAIVIVIIGLLVGVILVGKELIMEAKLRNLYRQFDSFKTAMMTFRLKYNYLPGDYPRGYINWGADPHCVNATIGSFASNWECNGTGDNVLNQYNSGETQNSVESLLSWYHLSFSKILQVSLDGTTGHIQGFAYGNKNAPGISLSDSGYWGFATINGNPYYTISKQPDTSYPILTGTIPRDIDIKFDDGNAIKGNIKNNASWGCYNTATGTYIPQVLPAGCIMQFYP